MNKSIFLVIMVCIGLLFLVGCSNDIDTETITISGNVANSPENTETDASESSTDISEQDEVNTPDEIEAVLEEAEEEDEEPAPPVERSTTYTVNLIDGGFEVPEIYINAGDTVVWQNVREGRVSKAMIIGIKSCKKIKSPVFNPGDVFSWTFNEPGTCEIVGGIYTTQLMKVIVTE